MPPPPAPAPAAAPAPPHSENGVTTLSPAAPTQQADNVVSAPPTVASLDGGKARKRTAKKSSKRKGSRKSAKKQRKGKSFRKAGKKGSRRK